MDYQPKKSRQLLHHLLAFERTDQLVEIDEIAVTCPRLPAAFHGARIAVVADVHFPDALLSVPMLVKLVADCRPDAIFLCGDLTNSYAAFDERRLSYLAQALVAIAPCYAVAGNHEHRLGREAQYAAILRQHGVHYLCDSAAVWQRNGACIKLYGMGHHRPKSLPFQSQPSIVLAHKPNYFPYYRQARWNLVVCGHAHGGQIRLGRHALFAPDQGFLPRYTGGLYAAGDTVMAVSRGLGNSSIPWRIHNRPHLPVLILEPK